VTVKDREMVLLQGYDVDDPAAVQQVEFAAGESLHAYPPELILKTADWLRANGWSGK
jgi:hypothetical protein